MWFSEVAYSKCHLFTGRGNLNYSPKYMGRSHSAVHKSYTTCRAAALDEGNTFGGVGLRICLYRTYSLSLQHFNNQSAGTQWSFSVKIGSIAVLLLWALSECINNELSEKDIWNVSSNNSVQIALVHCVTYSVPRTKHS
jgi:hypothetical protein